MYRAVICLAGLALFGAWPAAGQEEQRPTHVYEAYYRISPADMQEWNRQYREYSIPVLEQLRDEGVIQGWSHWQHSAGGEYNLRFAVRTYDWAALGKFWDEYLPRLQEATPDDEWQAGARMIAEHRDEIWEIGELNMTPGTEVSHVYASTFRVNFDDMSEWSRIWSEVAVPVLDQAIEDGILAGWVRLNHNTGGPHNSKILYFFDSWDDIDDMFESLGQTMQQEHADEMARVTRMIMAHGDVIWVPTPSEEM